MQYGCVSYKRAMFFLLCFLSLSFSAISYGGKRKRTTPPRPMNSFMLFNKEKRKEIERKLQKELHRTLNISELSTAVGNAWKSMSEAEKKPYKDMQREAEMEHARKYPDYQYRPGVKNKSKKTRTKQRKEDLVDNESDSESNEDSSYSVLGDEDENSSFFDNEESVDTADLEACGYDDESVDFNGSENNEFLFACNNLLPSSLSFPCYLREVDASSLNADGSNEEQRRGNEGSRSFSNVLLSNISAEPGARFMPGAIEEQQSINFDESSNCQSQVNGLSIQSEDPSLYFQQMTNYNLFYGK